jgi:tripartite-type tricarboxylate transporter receptor subunit TctC
MPEAPSWISLFALKGTPPSTVERVAGLVKKALEDPQIQRKLLTGGLAAHYQSPQEFARQMAQDSQFYAKLIRDNKIVLD